MGASLSLTYGATCTGPPVATCRRTKCALTTAGSYPLGNPTRPTGVVKGVPTFTPPTYQRRFDPERDGGYDLMRFYQFPVGYSVLITGGVATPHPGRTVPTQSDIEAADAGSGFGGRAAFIGGRTYQITSAEETILVAAGYAVDA